MTWLNIEQVFWVFLNKSDVQGEVHTQSKSLFLPLARLLSDQVTGILVLKVGS